MKSKPTPQPIQRNNGRLTSAQAHWSILWRQRQQIPVSEIGVGFGYECGLKVRSRRLLVTTNTDENAIAAPANMGFSSPAAASGNAAML